MVSTSVCCKAFCLHRSHLSIWRKPSRLCWPFGGNKRLTLGWEFFFESTSWNVCTSNSFYFCSQGISLKLSTCPRACQSWWCLCSCGESRADHTLSPLQDSHRHRPLLQGHHPHRHPLLFCQMSSIFWHSCPQYLLLLQPRFHPHLLRLPLGPRHHLHHLHHLHHHHLPLHCNLLVWLWAAS